MRCSLFSEICIKSHLSGDERTGPSRDLSFAFWTAAVVVIDNVKKVDYNERKNR